MAGSTPVRRTQRFRTFSPNRRSSLAARNRPPKAPNAGCGATERAPRAALATSDDATGWTDPASKLGWGTQQWSQRREPLARPMSTLKLATAICPSAGVEYYYYDQLGSAYSDQPDEGTLWKLDRFVDEVEQVRQALDLERESFVLYGQSWGGILAIEYALAYPGLKGLVISNMMSDVPAYNADAQNVLKPAMDQDALREIEALEAACDIESPRYMELLYEPHYLHHVLRMPLSSGRTRFTAPSLRSTPRSMSRWRDQRAWDKRRGQAGAVEPGR